MRAVARPALVEVVTETSYAMIAFRNPIPFFAYTALSSEFNLRLASLAPRILLLVFVWMVSSGCSAQNQPGATLPESPTPQPPAKPPGFFARWAEFYRQDWHGTASQGPAPPRRGLPSPLESPPFPNSDWSYGGSPVIGEADTNSYPLMTAWNQARSRTKVYGWVEPTVNFSTSTNSNAPEANDVYSNRFEMNQLVLYVERLPDSVQREHVDVGYHLTAFYGTDYRYTTDKGYLSFQWISDHHQYGFDPVLEYIDIYVPKVANGMNLASGAATRMMTSSVRACTIPATGVRPPHLTLVAVRAMAPVAAMPPKSGLAMLAIPNAINSWFGLCRSSTMPSATTAHNRDSIAASNSCPAAVGCARETDGSHRAAATEIKALVDFVIISTRVKCFIRA